MFFRVRLAGVPLTGVGWCGDHRLVTATGDGHLLWLDLDATTLMAESSRVRVDDQDGAVEQIIQIGQCTYARTHHNALYCFDER